ncbi:MAG: hypothetical protein U0412_04075 [Nitrospira sp.]
MPKLITVQRPEQIAEQAKSYVKTYILLPSGLLGFVSMIVGVGGLGYQLVATDSYTWGTFSQSSALILLGAGMGLAQTKYHQYLLQTFPEILAARMRSAAVKENKKAKKAKAEPVPAIDHAGRQFVPALYAAGAGVILGASWLVVSVGQTALVPAVLLPWAGFYWARLFFWRGRV